jgi:hypothetical protein
MRDVRAERSQIQIDFCSLSADSIRVTHNERSLLSSDCQSSGFVVGMYILLNEHSPFLKLE